MSSPTIIKWTTPGKILLTDAAGKPVSGPAPIETGDIKVTEEGNSFYLPNDEGELITDAAIAGVPVNANLAVYLIKQLYDKLAKITGEAGTGGNPVLTPTETWLIGLLSTSRAITLDKNALLKTVSQPGCEGVRLYLCTKPEFDAGEQPVDILSVVAVGVDKDGKDLGYEFDSAVATAIKENDSFRVPTKSLAVEFNYPPPYKAFAGASAEETFVIGSYAW